MIPEVRACSTLSGTTAPTDISRERRSPGPSLDPAFGSGGKVTTGISGSDDQAFALALQSDGKLVAGVRRRTGRL
jgi:hypothetical protein